MKIAMVALMTQQMSAVQLLVPNFQSNVLMVITAPKRLAIPTCAHWVPTLKHTWKVLKVLINALTAPLVTTVTQVLMKGPKSVMLVTTAYLVLMKLTKKVLSAQLDITVLKEPSYQLHALMANTLFLVHKLKTIAQTVLLVTTVLDTSLVQRWSLVHKVTIVHKALTLLSLVQKVHTTPMKSLSKQKIGALTALLVLLAMLLVFHITIGKNAQPVTTVKKELLHLEHANLVHLDLT
jgi:hypothetical protein